MAPTKKSDPATGTPKWTNTAAGGPLPQEFGLFFKTHGSVRCKVYDYVLLPINLKEGKAGLDDEGDHWVALVVDLKRASLHYMDSLASLMTTEKIESITQRVRIWLELEYYRCIRMSLPAQAFDSHAEPRVPNGLMGQQLDGVSCGAVRSILVGFEAVRPPETPHPPPPAP